MNNYQYIYKYVNKAMCECDFQGLAINRENVHGFFRSYKRKNPRLKKAMENNVDLYIQILTKQIFQHEQWRKENNK